MSQFPRPRRHDGQSRKCCTPLFPRSCARGRSPFAGHTRAREPLLILLTLAIEPTCPLVLTDPLSTRASTKPGDTSHAKPTPSTPLRKQAPLGGHVAPCHRRRESGFTKIGASFSGKRGHSCPAELAPSSNERNTVPACPGHVSAVWVRLCRSKGGLAHRPNDVQSPPWASILPCRDLRRVRPSWRHSRSWLDTAPAPSWAVPHG
jgi:hypothetical protein